MRKESGKFEMRAAILIMIIGITTIFLTDDIFSLNAGIVLYGISIALFSVGLYREDWASLKIAIGETPRTTKKQYHRSLV